MAAPRTPLNPTLILRAFLAAEDVNVAEASDMYRVAGLRAVPLTADKRPFLKEFGLHDHPRSVFEDHRAKGIGIVTGSLGNGIVAFDHDDAVYRDAFLRYAPPTLGIGRAGELRKSILILDDGELDAKRCAPPPSASVDIPKGEFGYFKAGAADAQHQVVVPPGEWHGKDGETQALEVVEREEPAVLDRASMQLLVQRVHADVLRHYGLPDVDVWAEKPSVSAHTPVVQVDTTLYTHVRAALQRLAGKMRECTEEGNGRTDMLWRYACIASTYARAGAIADDEAQEILRSAAMTWGDGHSASRIEDQIRRAWVADMSQNALADLRRWQGTAPKPAQKPTTKVRTFAQLAQVPRDGLIAGKTDARIGAHLIDKWGAAAATGQAVYIYDKPAGVWVAGDSQQVTGAVIACSGMPVDTEKGVQELEVGFRLAETTAKYIKAHPRIYDPQWLVDAPVGLCLRNGYLTQDAELKPHSPAHRALCRVEIDYDAGAHSPALDVYFERVFRDDPDGPNKIALLQEFVGLSLLGLVPRTQKALVLYGSGGNGKGKLIEIIRGIFPPALITSVNPGDFASPIYRTALIGSRINVVDEMPSVKMQRTDVLKALISGDIMQAEAKYCMPVQFRPMAGHIFSVNDLPPAEDITRGFFRRFEVIEFGRRMDIAEESDRDIDRKVLREREGVLAWAIAGARRFLARGNYTSVKSSDALKDRWMESSDSVADFASERLTPSDDITLDNRDIYREYCRFCSEHGYDAKDARTVGRTLRILGYTPTRDGRSRGFRVALQSRTMHSSRH